MRTAAGRLGGWAPDIAAAWDDPALVAHRPVLEIVAWLTPGRRLP